MLIGYARVSTEDQNDDLQVKALKEAGCEQIYIDHASGGDRDRPQLIEALGSLGPGKVLVFWKLDRLARSTLHLAEIAEHVTKSGAAIRCLTQPIDTTTSTGRFTFHILAAVAELERSLIAERVKAGMAAAKARGIHCGRPRKNREIAL